MHRLECEPFFSTSSWPCMLSIKTGFQLMAMARRPAEVSTSTPPRRLTTPMQYRVSGWRRPLGPALRLQALQDCRRSAVVACCGNGFRHQVHRLTRLLEIFLAAGRGTPSNQNRPVVGGAHAVTGFFERPKPITRSWASAASSSVPTPSSSVSTAAVSAPSLGPAR